MEIGSLGFSIYVHVLISYFLLTHSLGPTNTPLYGNLGLSTHPYEGLLLIRGNYQQSCYTIYVQVLVSFNHSWVDVWDSRTAAESVGECISNIVRDPRTLSQCVWIIFCSHFPWMRDPVVAHVPGSFWSYRCFRF